MSKGEGLKIGIKFTEDLIGDISPPITSFETQDGDWTANGTYSSFAVDRAKDGDTSSYWQSRSSSNYIQITRPNTKLLGIKVYKGSSYRPRGYTVRTSEDGNNYTDIESGDIENVTGWEEIMFDEPVLSDYFRLNFGYSSRLYLYELVLIVEGYDNEVVNDFVITGREYQYVKGSLIDKRYKVMDYERHPIEPNSILLTLDWWSRFNNVEGDITVKYHSGVGTLAGILGDVKNFEETFTPTDLVPEPNPGIQETITVAPSELTTSLKPITYTCGFAKETITVAPSELTVALREIE